MKYFKQLFLLFCHFRDVRIESTDIETEDEAQKVETYITPNNVIRIGSTNISIGCSGSGSYCPVHAIEYLDSQTAPDYIVPGRLNYPE